MPSEHPDYTSLLKKIKLWSKELGFEDIGISDINLKADEQHFLNWLQQNYHGEMDYMSRHGTKRSRPDQLIPGTLRIISLRMNYLPHYQHQALKQLYQAGNAYISRYALGRDYHKLIRKRLSQLADKIQSEVQDANFRVFTDSAPVLEKPLAVKANLGWMGKHSNLIKKDAGSWFFLGEIYTDLPLPITLQDDESKNHCGKCTNCIDVCPTKAIVKPYVVDAAKCISYLTIEYQGSIPQRYRKAIGNRIYGCDDCQLYCPWNKFAVISKEKDFLPRHNLDQATLFDLFQWSETEFLEKFQGSAIRRITYQSWQRNIIIALGNYLSANQDKEVVSLLKDKKVTANPLIKEHIDWALNQTKEL